MPTLKHRTERIERQLKMSATAGGDRTACPQCCALDALLAKVGIGSMRWPPVCPGHPERTPEQAKADGDAAVKRLWAKMQGTK